MDFDELATFTTPPAKRRKLVMVSIPTPTKLSDLLSAFGAQQSPSSVSKIRRVSDAMDLRPQKPVFSYAESSATNSPTKSDGGSDFGSPVKSSVNSQQQYDDDSDEEGAEESGDELNSDDVIHVAQTIQTIPKATRELPKRSTRSRVSYATPKKAAKKGSKAGRTKKPSKLTSDLYNAAAPKIRAPLTDREQVHADIAAHTKPKRDAFYLANHDYFMPLLPETSYIDKLQRVRDMNGEDEVATVPYQLINKQPKGITATMKPYQLVGLSFLVYMHKTGMSSILGDEMGLGKTLQTLSLFQWLRENEPTAGEQRPFLVVCPLSVLSSWMNETRKWAPELNVVRFHGPAKEREKLKEECKHASKDTKIDIMVTTYETFVSEQNWFKRAFVWRYCVLDEGHKIKNDKSDVASSLQSLKAEYRLLLTGTPLNNNLHELWALLHWLYPDVFTADTGDLFKRAFDLNKGKVSTTFMDDARRLLELIMLRRMKHSPGVDLGLPPKTEVLLFVPMTPMQRFWYMRLITRVDSGMLDQLFKGAKSKEMQSLQQEAEEQDDTLLAKAEQELSGAAGASDDVWAESKEIMDRAVQNEEAADTKSSDWRKLMNLVLQLRKVCNHPYILPGAQPNPYYLGPHVINASGKYIVLDKLMDQLVLKQKKKILIFSGFTSTLNLCEDLLILKGANAINNANFRYLRLDGGTARAKRNLGIRMFNDPKSDFQVMLISTRAGGLGVNLATATDVVFMDEDWNPQIGLQAEARAHRIGQTKPVTIYKLCTQGTVEEQMLGRIRKKLYLSAKITESMRNIHGEPNAKKRKRGPSDVYDDDAPQLDTGSLKSLIRRGAQTLSRPEVDVTEMLKWDWETTLDQCKDKPLDAMDSHSDAVKDEAAEKEWLNSMERVETAVFEGRKHQKAVEQAVDAQELNRADRRVGKNTTVMVDGFAINKGSMNCADWEAVPTFAGKDPRLAEPEKIKKAKVVNQDHCQTCWDTGEVVCCSGCPRSYHRKCLSKPMQVKAKGKMNFFCPQHECLDCGSKTAEAGGLIYRCRWCENGFCEDCLDWENVKLLGETLPEYEMLGQDVKENAWFVECPACNKSWEEDGDARAYVDRERKRIEREYAEFLAKGAVMAEPESTKGSTPATISEVQTPQILESDDEVEVVFPVSKKAKVV